MLPASLVKLVPELGHANVRMKDPNFVETTIKAMMKDAHHRLQVIADFDRTLSKYSENGKICSTSHGVIEESEFMPANFKTEAKKLKDEFLPIEFDHSKTVEEKIPKMIEWWCKGHELLANSGLTRDLLRQIVAKSDARLRDGCGVLFETLNRLDIPLLLFSAGLGDVIREAIEQQSAFCDNMKLVSNFIHFDDSGKMLGFSGDNVIHTFNKNEYSILHSDYFERIKHRSNILLLGDSIGDVHMAKGAEQTQCLLKVGFMNFKVEEDLPVYLDHFDVVILLDETMDVVNGIVKAVTSSETSQETSSNR